MSIGRNVLAAGCAVLAMCGSSRAADLSHCPGVIYVAVAANGMVSIDGQIADPLKINETLTTLQPGSKFILYYRENGAADVQGDSRIKVERVLDAMMKLRLPISLSSKPDYSDGVDQNGNSHPRTSCPQ